ncbi:MAG: antiterminator Q family protein [Pasteurella oralis]|uniref:antiterminator Q family protein n=1 Tax=Pasteurella oralis TaxID=1071947 RepID=UPI0026F92DA8|nr:antiterminator Q family protein [Pasteurella oralis]
MLESDEQTLTFEQELFVDEWMYKWGNWVRTERFDKSQCNIIAKLMQSVTPAERSEAICDDETGMMISQTIDQFFANNDPVLRFIVFSYYVNKSSVNKIAITLRNNSAPIPMQPYNSKSKIRIPSVGYFRKEVRNELKLAKSIIYDFLIIGFSLLRRNKIKRT